MIDKSVSPIIVKPLTEHEDAVYETRIGMMDTIMEEVGYFGLLAIVRDAIRRNMVEGGQSEQYADSCLVSCAREVVAETK